MKSLPKFIFYFIVIGVICGIIKLYFAQANMAQIAEDKVYPWFYKVGLIGNAFISLASIASFYRYKKFFPSYISVCYILLILFVFIASLGDLSETLTKAYFFYSIKGLGTFINIGILFFAADTLYFPKILKLFYNLSFVIIIAGFVTLSGVGIGADRKEFLLAIRDYSVYLIWVFPYFFLQENTDKKKNIINMSTFLVIFIFILSSGSRTYLIIYLLYVAVKFKTKLQTKTGMLAILGLVVLAAGGYFILMNSGLERTLSGAVTNLSERTVEDTRSGQLIDFLSQYDMGYLIQGVGPIKQWNWHGFGMYSYLDNQVLLIAWWAGLPTILTYIYFLVKSFYIKSEILLFEDIRGIKLIIGLWIAACLGFAIYVTLSSELYYYFISLIIGMSTCHYSKILEPENE